MKRLTKKTLSGNWKLKGMEWDHLCTGSTITGEMSQKLYGVLCKLKDYADTGLEPAEVLQLKKRQDKRRWIPVNDYLPSNYAQVFCMAECRERPNVKAYFAGFRADEFWFMRGLGASCMEPAGYRVIAWEPLPVPYQCEPMDEEMIRAAEEYKVAAKWIPVTKRLPEKGRQVLVCSVVRDHDDNGDGYFMQTGAIMSDCWMIQTPYPDVLRQNENTEVLAWMPLPKPYREEW